MQDEMIISMYEARDERAIEMTAAEYGRLCQSIAEGILLCREDAEECVSGAYMKLWNAIPPAKPKSLSAYLGRIVRNLALNFLEKRQAEKRGGEVLPLLDELAECLPAAESGEEIGLLLDRFFSSLTTENRRLFLRRYWYCDSIGVLSRRFALSESAVKVRLHRMREALRRELEKEGISL